MLASKQLLATWRAKHEVDTGGCVNTKRERDRQGGTEREIELHPPYKLTPRNTEQQ